MGIDRSQKLSRTFCGLRRSPVFFFKNLASNLKEYGSDQFRADLCTLPLTDKSSPSNLKTIIVGEHVDKIVVVSSRAGCDVLIRLLEKPLLTKNLELRLYTGCVFERDDEGGVKKYSNCLYRPVVGSLRHFFDKLRSRMLVCQAQGEARR